MERYYIRSTKYTIQERKTKNNGKVYDCVFRIWTPDGTMKQKKLSGYKTKAEATRAHDRFMTEYCTAEPNKVRTFTKSETPKYIVADTYKKYIRAMESQIKGSTVYNSQKYFENYIIPYFGECEIKDITKPKLLLWQDELCALKNPRTGKFYSWEHIRNIRSAFSAFLSWCASRYETPNNLKGLDKPRRSTVKNEMQIWTEEEFKQFIQTVDDPMYHCLFMMMFYTGRRKGEILAVTKKDIKNNTISFTKSVSRQYSGNEFDITTTKTGKTLTVPICKPLIEELKQYKGQEPFFFGGEKPLPAETVRRKFGKYTEKAGVRQIRIHDLRHSFVSMLIHYGANLTVVASLISDTLEQVTKTYAHMYISDQQSVIDRIK